MDGPYKRVNVMIHEDQYQTLNQRELNISGLIRDLLGDYLAENVINLQVSEETRQIYDLLVANSDSSDAEIENHLRVALAQVLEQKIQEMKILHQQLLREAEQN